MPLQYYKAEGKGCVRVIKVRVTYATHEAVAMPLGTLGLERID